MKNSIDRSFVFILFSFFLRFNLHIIFSNNFTLEFHLGNSFLLQIPLHPLQLDDLQSILQKDSQLVCSVLFHSSFFMAGSRFCVA